MQTVYLPENFYILLFRILYKTSRKWLTVAIFRKWQDWIVAVTLDIVVNLDWS